MGCDKIKDMQTKRLLGKSNLAKAQEVHLVACGPIGSKEGIFLKDLLDINGYLIPTIFWIYEFDGVGENIGTFVGTLGELINNKYYSNSRYTLQNYEHETIAENMTVLELILKMKELSSIL